MTEPKPAPVPTVELLRQAHEVILLLKTGDEYTFPKLLRDLDAAMLNLSNSATAANTLPEELQEPKNVWLNMLHGKIAKPTIEQIKHLYPELVASTLPQAPDGFHWHYIHTPLPGVCERWEAGLMANDRSVFIGDCSGATMFEAASAAITKTQQSVSAEME